MIRAISLGSKRVNIDGFEMKYWNPTLILFFEIKCNFQELKSVISYPLNKLLEKEEEMLKTDEES